MHSDFYSFKYLNAMRRFISASIAASLLLFCSNPVLAGNEGAKSDFLKSINKFKKDNPHLTEEYCMRKEIYEYPIGYDKWVD